MKKILLTLAVMAMVAVSCQREDEQGDWRIELDIELENVLGKIEQTTEVDDALLTDALLNYAIKPIFLAIEKDGEWEATPPAPGLPGCCGLVFYETEVFEYYVTVPDDKVYRSDAYAYHYDATTNTLYSESTIHDYTYSCEVKYFDGSYLIIEGLLAPLDDIYNDFYADRKFLRELKVNKEIRKSLEDGTYTPGSSKTSAL